MFFCLTVDIANRPRIKMTKEETSNFTRTQINYIKAQRIFKSLLNTPLIESKMEQPRLHDCISPRQVRLLIAKSRWKDSTTRLRWESYDQDHRWHKECCQPLQLEVPALVLEADRSPSTPVFGCHQCRWQPGWWDVSFEGRNFTRRIVLEAFWASWMMIIISQASSMDIHGFYQHAFSWFCRVTSVLESSPLEYPPVTRRT